MRSSFEAAGQTRILYVLAGAVSLILSYWISSHQAIINPDAICYLLSAKEMEQSGVRAAMQLCGQASWPFYAALIVAFSKVSMLSMTASAYLLDACFTLITVLSFITIVNMLGGTRRVLWLAAFVILSAHQFNAVRQYIVRDHGFWAFYLVSMIFMLRFLREQSFKNAYGFGVSLMVAALFRIEGAVFLALLPLLVFFHEGSFSQRARSYLKLNSAAILGVMVLGVWLVMHPQQSIEKLGRVAELRNQLLHGVTIVSGHYQAAKASLAQYVLPHEAVRDAGMVWLAVLVVLYLANIAGNLTIAATALLIYGWLTGVTQQFSRAGKLTLISYMLVNVVISAVFFAERLFFSKRYLIAMTLILLLWLPFTLEKLLRARVDSRRRYAAYTALVLLLASSAGVVFDNGASKNHVREAGVWIAENIPASAKLYSNDLQLSYYSQHYGQDLYKVMNQHRDVNAALQSKLQQYDYVALLMNKKRDERLALMLNAMQVPVVKNFVNNHGDYVAVYKMPQHAVQLSGG